MRKWKVYSVTDIVSYARSADLLSLLDAIFEISLLCLLYTINIILNFEYITPFMILSENMLFIFAYVGARYFLPKADFKLRITAVFALSSAIAFPALVFHHTFFEITSTTIFMLFSSLIVGILSCALDDDNRISALLVYHDDVGAEILSAVTREYDIFAIIHTGANSANNQHICFKSFKYASRFLNVIRHVVLFRLPTAVIYVDDKYDISRFFDVSSFAKSFNLSLFDKFGNKFTADSFLNKSCLSESESLAVSNLLSHKKVIIEYNGNPVLLETIKRFSTNNSIELIVSCICQELLMHIMNIKNISVTTSPLYSVIQSTSNIDYVFASSTKVCNEANFELKKYSAVCNSIQYLNIIDACDERRVKHLYLISQLCQDDNMTLNDYSQRLAESCAQSAYTTTADCFTKIVSVRIPATFPDIRSEDHQKSTILIENKYAECSAVCDALFRLLVNVAEQKDPGKSYNITAKSGITIDDYIKLLSITNENNIRICKQQINNSLTNKIYNHTIETTIPDVFISAENYKRFSIEDIESILQSKTENELMEKLNLYTNNSMRENYNTSIRA